MKRVFQQLLQAVTDNGSLVSCEVRFWDGERLRIGEEEPAFVLGFETERALKRTLSEGSLGFGEEYMAGHITVEGDWQPLIRLGLDPRIQNLKLPWHVALRMLWHAVTSRNTLRRAPRNIAYHYDRGNEFYRLWLDESMTYSCAYFRRPDDTLEQAQQQKYEHICRKLQLQLGDTLVDIGCGWGGMLMYAARHYGVRGVGCTLSQPQVEWARATVAREHLEQFIRIERQDYRQLSGQFDKLVSIGMFEHVGKQFIPTFMAQARALLKPGGLGLLHTIGKDRPSAGDPWTMKYIFPGAYLPLLDEILREMGKAGLVPIDVENLRLHYSETLRQWRQRFEAHAAEIEAMFDARFVRMWRMFLNSAEAGFRYGNLRLYQITFTNGLNNALPWTREHLYVEALNREVSPSLISTR
ncbi:MAG: cyclopropane-fatty-acyl-phospholipid synthase family protein [Blastocatellia bacterium]|nr:cyclopropane-fatty-acyl-phospholipid synthase family protein [Blastocatellia bacterium]